RWHSVEVENAPSGGSSSHETSECQYSPAMRLELASAWMVGEIVRVDIFQSNEHPRDAGSLRLRDEVFDFVAKSVDLDHQAERNPALLPEFDQTIEDRLPLLVAREIVVGDEEFVDPLRPVETHEMLDVVGRAVARLTALHVDDRAE